MQVLFNVAWREGATPRRRARVTVLLRSFGCAFRLTAQTQTQTSWSISRDVTLQQTINNSGPGLAGVQGWRMLGASTGSWCGEGWSQETIRATDLRRG